MSNGYTEHFLAVIDDKVEGKSCNMCPSVKVGWGWRSVRTAIRSMHRGRRRLCRWPFNLPRRPADGSRSNCAAKRRLSRRLGTRQSTASASTSRVTWATPGRAQPADKKIVSNDSLGNKPYTCAISRNEKTAYVSNWGEDNVAVVDLVGRKGPAQYPGTGKAERLAADAQMKRTASLWRTPIATRSAWLRRKAAPGDRTDRCWHYAPTPLWAARCQ